MAAFEITPARIREKAEHMRDSFDRHISNGRLNTQQASAAFHAFSNRWEAIACAACQDAQLHETRDNDTIQQAVQIMQAANTPKGMACHYDSLLRRQVTNAPFFKGYRLITSNKA